jgi:hypothetical protein
VGIRTAPRREDIHCIADVIHSQDLTNKKPLVRTWVMRGLQHKWYVYPLTKPLQVLYDCTNGLTWADYKSP